MMLCFGSLNHAPLPVDSMFRVLSRSSTFFSKNDL